ncbi:MAG: helical backbone metal receptor, partial [Chloroflexota bacterium]|nr:helical backbone metal receptor [Chloroflexota bacterium]
MIRSRYPLILALVFTLAACDAPAAPYTTQAPPVAESASPAPVAPPAEPTTAPLATPLPLSTPQLTMRVVATAVAYPLTITDSLGRSLTLTAAPRRIVSLAPSNTEILFAVGVGEQVVGVTKYCNYPEEAQQREQIGGFSAKTISVETIVALKPDLVVAGDESQQEVIDALVGLKIPVMALKASTFEEVYRTIELIGQVTGHSEQASKVVADMRTRVDAVTGKVASIPQAERVSVFWEVFD